MNISLLPKISNATWKAHLLSEYFPHAERILDFGCGDLSMAKELLRFRQNLSITGIDVTEGNETITGIPYIRYDGSKLPFGAAVFDSVIAFYVFHHCDDPEAAFTECLRVAKKRVIIVESIYRWKNEIPYMRFMDWLYNVIKRENIALPYTFLSLPQWKAIIQKKGARILSLKRMQQLFLPRWAPMGITQIIEVEKRVKSPTRSSFK